MSELIGLLGTLSALLTLAGTYRFANFFFQRGLELTILFAVAVTAIYLAFFELIILFMGFVAIGAPFVGASYWYRNSGMSIPNPLNLLTGGGSTGNQARSGNGKSGGSGQTNGGSGTSGGGNSGTGGSGSDTTNKCKNCDKENPPSERFCTDCGWKLDT